MPPDLLDPKKFPTYLVLSALLSAAIGLFVYNFNQDQWLAVGIGGGLFLADAVGLRLLMRSDDD